MVWFKVDDSLHSHPKAMAASLAAIGLWSVSGSWSSDHLTDGFVPDYMIPSLARGQIELAEELCAVGLWRRRKGGYQFHQWLQDADGTVRNPSRDDVTTKRAKRAEAGRKGGLASGKTRSKPRSNREANASADRSGIVEPPSRPVPSRRDVDGTVGGHLQVADAREDDDILDRLVVGIFADLTGRKLKPEAAARIRRQILGDRRIDNPAAYLAKAIADNPAKFAPPPRHPSERSVAEAIADATRGDP